jgi:FkbM family methyltransferase
MRERRRWLRPRHFDEICETNPLQAMTQTADDVAPGNTCFVVTACQKDIHYARMLLASMHWFCAEFPVIVIGDGGLKASAVSNLPNVHRFYDSGGIPASRSLLLRGLLSKLNLFFLDEFDYYVFCDADSILIGDLMGTMKGQRPFDFLGLDSRGQYDMANEEHRKMYSHYVFSIDEAQKRACPLPYDALVYFQSSHFCVKRNAQWAGLIEEWRHEMKTDYSPEGFLKFGDQGFLNFAVNSLGHAKRMKVKMTSVVINGKRNPADFPDVNMTRIMEKRPGTQDVIHYTAHSRRLTLKAHNFGWALEHFDRHCYSLRGQRACIGDKTRYFCRKLGARVAKSRPGGYALRLLKKGRSLYGGRQQFKNSRQLQQRVAAAIAHIRSPFLVKVGANDGITRDPLFPVFDKFSDWRGLFIEPVPFCFERLQKNFSDSNRFILENVAVDRQSGRKPFYFVRQDAKSFISTLPSWYDQIGSFDRKHILKHLNGALEAHIEQCSIACMPLPAIFEKHGLAQIDVLHIDTEGHDYVVLSQFDFDKYSPSVVFFECKHLTKEERMESLKLLRMRQYRLFDCGVDFLAVGRANGER